MNITANPPNRPAVRALKFDNLHIRVTDKDESRRMVCEIPRRDPYAKQ